MRLFAARRAPLAVAAIVVALGALGFAAAPVRAAEAPYPPYPSALIVKSEMRLKASLLQRNLDGSPQLVFFGGSRNQRLDPAFARRRLGLRAVNIAVSCAKPEVAWGYANWFYKRWPDAQLRWVWGMQSGMIRDADLDPALLQDARFYPYFPDDLLKRQRELLPASPDKVPHFYGFLRNRYSSHGMLLWNVYDKRFAAGYTLDEALDAYIARMLHESPRKSAAPATRASAYLEKTVELLNAHGTTPVFVLMPVHPRVLRVMSLHHIGGAREELGAYLAGLAERYDLKVVDLTRIQSFGGKPDWFYDGVHITRPNADRVITTLKAKAGEYLK